MAEVKKTVLVVSAHAADFVWRAGGAIALYSGRGYRVRILCLSYGERGESERTLEDAIDDSGAGEGVAPGGIGKGGRNPRRGNSIL